MPLLHSVNPSYTLPEYAHHWQVGLLPRAHLHGLEIISMSGQAGDTAACPSVGPTAIQHSPSLQYADNCYNSGKVLQEGPPFPKPMLHTHEYQIICTPKGGTVYCSVYKHAGIGIRMRFLGKRQLKTAMHPLHKPLGITMVFFYKYITT